MEVTPGSLWSVGRHLLYCGSATDWESYKRLVSGARPVMCLTDPPFGVEGTDEPDAQETLRFFNHVPSSLVAMTFPVDLHFHTLARATAGWQLRRELCLVRRGARGKIGNYRQQHVPVLIFIRGEPMTWDVPPRATTVVVVREDFTPSSHSPKPRPHKLWRQLIESHSRVGDAVIDPFVGSGTTIFVCEDVRRRCLAMDVDPAVCAALLRRAANRGFACEEVV